MHGSGEEKERPAAAGAGEARFQAQGGSLYVVATPLGNLRDLTLRALDVLASVDLIAAEDTRVTATLLRHYDVRTRMISLHAHNEAGRARELLQRLAAGHSVAMVSDAGTPAISDPGARLVASIKAAGFPVVPIPGPSAVVAAVCAAGLAAERFCFAGFLPTAPKARRTLLMTMAAWPCAIVFYEAPHRIVATVAELAAAFDAERILVVAREITKKFETIARMPLREGGAWFASDTDRTRGEFVLIVDVAALPAAASALDAAGERWLQALLEHLSPAQAARIGAAATGVPRAVLYAQALAMKAPDDRA